MVSRDGARSYISIKFFISRYFRCFCGYTAHIGIEYDWYLRFSKVDEGLRSGKVAVVSFWISQVEFYGIKINKYCKGMHTVAITYSSNQYNVYNRYNNSTEVTNYDSLEGPIRDGFIMGYILQ